MKISKFAVTKKQKSLIKKLIFVLPIFALIFVSACQRNEENSANSPATSPTVEEKKLTDFEADLAYVRSFNFNFVYAFRRTDGDIFSGDDKGFIKANIPVETNQPVLTKDGKCVIIGSNFKIAPEKLDALKKRFVFEDYSPAPSADDANANQNTATNVTNATANQNPANINKINSNAK